MFDNVTWEQAGLVALYVFIGLLLRTFGPYFVAAYQLVKETNEWKLPPFEPRYILPPMATLGIYILAILTIPDALDTLISMHPTLLVAAVYAGQDVFRQIQKLVKA